jgi:hypothetical protein
MNAQLDILLGKFGSLIHTIASTTAHVAVGTTLVSMLLVDEDVLVVHAIVVVFKSHHTTLERGVLVNCHLGLRVHHEFRLLLLLLLSRCIWIA